MTYTITITQKGQITIPKRIRDTLGLTKTDKVAVSFSNKAKLIQIKPIRDFLTVAKELKISEKIDSVKARELMEKNYERK